MQVNDFVPLLAAFGGFCAGFTWGIAYMQRRTQKGGEG